MSKKSFSKCKHYLVSGEGQIHFQNRANPIAVGLIDQIREEDFGSNILDLFRRNKFGKYDIVIDTQKRFLTTF